MLRFKFRLKTVQNHRKVILDQKLALKAEILAERDRILNERAHLEALYQQTLFGGAKVGDYFNAQTETWRQLRLFSLREEIKIKEHELSKIEQHLEEIQAEVTEAHRNLKAMEILEAKDRKAWQQEYRVFQQKQTDEMNMTRFKR